MRNIISLEKGSKKIQDWNLKSERIRKRICVSLLNRSIQDLSDHGTSKEPKNPPGGFFGSWIDLFSKRKRKIRFRILSDSFGFKIPIWDFLTETHPYVTAFLSCHVMSLTRKTKLAISHALFYTSTGIYSSVDYSISVNTVQKRMYI